MREINMKTELIGVHLFPLKEGIKVFLYFFGGTALGYLLLGFIQAAPPLDGIIKGKYIVFIAGVACGLLGKSCSEKKPWLLLFLVIFFLASDILNLFI
jgi:hypothetical protein